MNKEVMLTRQDEDIKTVLIDVGKLPIVIEDQVEALNNLDEKVKSALAKASKAHRAATSAKEKSTGWFKKKEAIEALQSSGYELSEAVKASAEAQEIAFEFQTKLAEITKYLFALGVSSLAHNRMVVRELELKLKGASANQLSELARKEVLNVVMQLKAQEDILSKQDRLAKKIEIQDDQLHLQTEKDKQHDKLLQEQIEKDKQHDKILHHQLEIGKLHSEQLNHQEEIDRKHDEALCALEMKYKEIESSFNLVQNTNNALQESCRANTTNIKNQEVLIRRLESDIVNYIKIVKTKVAISLIFAITSLIGTIVLCALHFHMFG